MMERKGVIHPLKADLDEVEEADAFFHDDHSITRIQLLAPADYVEDPVHSLRAVLIHFSHSRRQKCQGGLQGVESAERSEGDFMRR